jgi:hypothetical protein
MLMGYSQGYVGTGDGLLIGKRIRVKHGEPRGIAQLLQNPHSAH